MSTIKIRAAVLLAVLAVGEVVLAQTPIKLAKNKYTPEQDVEIGLKGAAEVSKQLPIIKNEPIAAYLATLGDRLVAAAPPELKNPAYRFSFTAVNLKDINAFALPGGPMFVNRGMFDAAGGEGEVVGVMAHELAHVLLRHGTANATKAENPWLQIGQIAGAVGGAMVGGGLGSMIADGAQFGLGTLLLKYSRDFEKQADILGVHIMAKAGYDPRDLAKMFETIGKASGGGRDPQWMSSHPDPGNRSAYIVKEAALVEVAASADASGFPAAKGLFAGLPAPASMAELSRRGAPTANTAVSTGTPGQPVPPPSAESRTISAGIFQVSVPANWATVRGENAVRVVPQNGYGDVNGQTIFTHGVEFGVAAPASRDLREATTAWLRGIAQGNPNLKLAGEAQQGKISGVPAIAIPLTNPSALGGSERIGVYTAFLSDGSLFYFLTVAPDADAQTYQQIFARIGQSIRFSHGR
jgi:hypothetical protein